MTGVYILKGMSVQVDKLTLTVDEEGNARPTLSLKVSYDACVAWGKIALKHREAALQALQLRETAWSPESPHTEEEKASTLENEFSDSTQAIVATAFCVDAFYDHVSRHVEISRQTRDSWKKQGTARFAQVAETFRIAFKMTNSETKQWRNYLKILYKLRDASVHPSNQPLTPYIHPQLNISTDWRLIAFRGDVADLITCNCWGMLWQFCGKESYKSFGITNFVKQFKPKLADLFPNGPPEPHSTEAHFTFPR